MPSAYSAVAHHHQGFSLRGRPGGYLVLPVIEDYRQSPAYLGIKSGKIAGPVGTSYWLIVNPEGDFVETLKGPQSAG